MKGLIRMLSLAVCLSFLLGGCGAAGDASPAPAAETPRTMEELRARLEEMVAGFDGEWSVYCKRRGDTDAIVINDVPMTAAR